LGEKEDFPVIIASPLTVKQEDDLLTVLRKNREAIGWTMADIQGISPSIMQHRIHLIKEAKPKRDPQHRLNSIMQEAVRVEILKLLDNGIIYLRSFLGHASFYRRYIKEFSKIARPLTNLLAMDVPFHF